MEMISTSFYEQQPLDQLLHYQTVCSNDLAGLRLEFPQLYCNAASCA